MVFMNNGGTVVEFAYENITNDKCFFFLAAACGHHYFSVTDNLHSSEDHINANIEVNIKKLESVMETALAVNNDYSPNLIKP